VLARNSYLIVDIISNILIPRMLNPTAWNWGARSGFYWAGSSFVCLTWAYFRLPEAKGRTYQELDILFQSGVSARRFKSTPVDLLAGWDVSLNSGPDEKAQSRIE
jgi:SP family general alpha glucoside:H+ symporter-like MFS transporter